MQQQYRRIDRQRLVMVAAIVCMLAACSTPPSPGATPSNVSAATSEPSTPQATGVTPLPTFTPRPTLAASPTRTITPTVVSMPTGTLLREYWFGIPGGAVADLTSNAAFPDRPTYCDLTTSFETPTDFADDFGTRIRGYLIPPTTGDYTFWIASDNEGELWLSRDADPQQRARIAYVKAYANPRQWDVEPNQRSSPIRLEAGKRYYVEALHKEGGVGDTLGVAWQGPNVPQQVISGAFISAGELVCTAVAPPGNITPTP